jgi:FkbM family methyltransferase
MTITLDMPSHPNKKMSIGQASEFVLRGKTEALELRAFLKTDHIFYLQPYRDWSPDTTIRYYPESPGRYTLVVQWRTTDGTLGSGELAFEVSAGEPQSNVPESIPFGKQAQFLMPTHWEAAYFARHEQATMSLLPELVRPGQVVYDIGANMGLYSLCFSRLVGPRGHVYCIEANPMCVYFLRANLERNGAKNHDILPVALMDGAQTCDFIINYGSSGLGIAQSLVSSSWGKPGHRVTVPADSLDHLLEQYPLQTPDFIKIDIEGGEGCAVRGMMKTLAQRRPFLLVELHGTGPAHETLALLDTLGYRYQETASRQKFQSAQQFMAWMPQHTCLQVVASAA